MANPFSQTMRSLHTDNFRVSLIGLITAIALGAVWGYWFFTAKVTFYETSKSVHVTNNEAIVTEFPSDRGAVTQRTFSIRRRVVVVRFSPEAMETIRRDQTAFLRLDGKIGKQVGAIPARVTDITYLPQGGGRVELLAEVKADAPNPFEEGVGGEAKIEVEYVTPVLLVLRASGLLTETAPTSFSP